MGGTLAFGKRKLKRRNATKRGIAGAGRAFYFLGFSFLMSV